MSCDHGRSKSRILIVGPSGAGKSTLAVEVAARLGLPLIHLDRYYWQPGWVATPEPEWRVIVSELVARPAWVMDGNFGESFDLRLPRADLIVFLDLPRRITIARVLRRIIGGLGKNRPDMAPGCPEKLDLEFLGWVWRFPRDERPRIGQAIGDTGTRERVTTLTTTREIRDWLSTLT